MLFVHTSAEELCKKLLNFVKKLSITPYHAPTKVNLGSIVARETTVSEVIKCPFEKYIHVRYLTVSIILSGQHNISVYIYFQLGVSFA